MKDKTYAFEGKILVVGSMAPNGKNWQVVLKKMRYGNGRTAIVAEDVLDGLPYGTLSVNLVNDSLGDDEVFIKSWSENEALADVARKSGYFIDTGKRVPSGFCVAEIWKMKGAKKEKPKPKNKYKNHLCGEECDISQCPEEPCHCEYGMTQLMDRAEMRADLARDAISDRMQKGE